MIRCATVNLLDISVQRKIEPLYPSMRQVGTAMLGFQYHSLEYFKNWYEIERVLIR